MDAPTDFFYTFTEQTVFTVRTENAEGSFSDPHLWFYTADGLLLAANDDHYGLQSFIEVMVEPGVYRLRAGFCCGDPDATRQGQRFVVTSLLAPTLTTTTIPETTTTITTTMVPETTTTTSTVPETTTTLEPTTTTDTPTTLVEPSTTVTVPETTLPVETSTSAIVNTTTSITTTTSTTAVQRTTIPPTTTIQSTTTVPATTVEPTTTTVPATTQVTPTTTQPETITVLPELENLTDAEALALVQQLNNAPTKLKKQFEETVDVFSGQFDSYIPVGSRVPVSERRTLIAVSGTLLTLGSTAPGRKNRR